MSICPTESLFFLIQRLFHKTLLCSSWPWSIGTCGRTYRHLCHLHFTHPHRLQSRPFIHPSVLSHLACSTSHVYNYAKGIHLVRLIHSCNSYPTSCHRHPKESTIHSGGTTTAATAQCSEWLADSTMTLMEARLVVPFCERIHKKNTELQMNFRYGNCTNTQTSWRDRRTDEWTDRLYTLHCSSLYIHNKNRQKSEECVRKFKPDVLLQHPIF